MAEADDLTTRPPENRSSTAGGRREIADFECNICFDIAQDPVITLCGHLHCWPCIYRWLKLHSEFHHCPVCKTRIEDQKLIPLYGRGKTANDPRLIPIPGVEIPRRPAGQRPDSPPPPPPPPPLPEVNASTDTAFGRSIGGFTPMAPTTSSHFGMPPIFSLRFREYGGSSEFNYGSFGEGGVDRESSVVSQGNDENLKKILVFILVFVLVDFLTM